MEKIRLHIDPKGVTAKPTNNEEWGTISNRVFQADNIVLVSVHELARKIGTGHTVCPAVMSSPKAADWQEQQIFMVDIDNADETQPQLSIKQALEMCDKNNLPPALYYQTFGYSTARQKYRLVFIMDKVIADPQERYIIVHTLVALFPQSDKKCTNTNRLFAGTDKKVFLHDENARISVERVMAISPPPFPEKQHSAQTSQVKMCADPELTALADSFDFLSYLAERNGAYRESGNTVYFKNCEVCGHKDDLRYYKDTNTFYCFSSDGEVGGSIIQYLMITEGLTLKEAINKLKYDLSDPEWHTPVPLEEYNLPRFPVEQFPQLLKEWVSAVAENTATAVDMAAVSVLAVMASTIQGKYEIMGKADYIEPLNLYVLLIANPGERKSAIVKAMTKDITQFEHEENQKRQPEIERQQTEINVMRQQLEKATKKGDTQEALLLKYRLRKLEADMPKYLRLIADNITPEALTSLMADNNGVLSVFSTEGGLFEILSGMYTKKGVNIDTLLKAHSGDPIRVDRKGRDNEQIDNPTLTMLLSVQENVIEGVLSNSAFIGRGLTARMLYSIPTSLMGTRDFDTAPIPPEMAQKYQNLIYRLLQLPPQDNGKPYLLCLEDSARELLEALHNWLEPQLIGDLSDMSGWSAKFVGATLRIAGVLHCVRHHKAPQDYPVSADTMNRAIAIGKYFLEHAKYTFSLMGADKAMQDAKYILKRLEGQNETSLKSAELHRLCKRFKKQDEMLPPLEMLMEYGYIKMKVGKKDTGGRPEGIYYELNPMYFGERSS